MQSQRVAYPQLFCCSLLAGARLEAAEEEQNHCSINLVCKGEADRIFKFYCCFILGSLAPSSIAY